jgi:hypothetical protein
LSQGNPPKHPLKSTTEEMRQRSRRYASGDQGVSKFAVFDSVTENKTISLHDDRIEAELEKMRKEIAILASDLATDQNEFPNAPTDRADVERYHDTHGGRSRTAFRRSRRLAISKRHARSKFIMDSVHYRYGLHLLKNFGTIVAPKLDVSSMVKRHKTLSSRIPPSMPPVLPCLRKHRGRQWCMPRPWIRARRPCATA